MKRHVSGTATAGAGVWQHRAGRGAAASTLKFVPAQDLARPTRSQSAVGLYDHAQLPGVRDVYGLDESYKAEPQMVEGHVIEHEAGAWKLAPRDGLKLPQRRAGGARDVVASLQRWGKRDTFGQTLFSVTDECLAPSDKVVQFRLKKPFPMIPDALGKIRRFFCDHCARASGADRADQGGMPEIIGTPLSLTRWRARAGFAERVCEIRRLLAAESGHAELPRRTEDRVERVGWHTIPDPATVDRGVAGGGSSVGPGDRRHTAAAAQEPQHRGQHAFHVRRWHAAANQTQPPFHNPAVRRAAMGAINQSDYMIAVAGEDQSRSRANCGFFSPGSPMATMSAWTRQRPARYREGAGVPWRPLATRARSWCIWRLPTCRR